MGSGKWMINGLLLGIVVLTASQLVQGEVPQKTAWVGGSVDLECGDGGPDSAQRIWEKEGDLLTVGPLDIVVDDWIYLVNSSAVLRIVNVTLDNQGYYTCTIKSRPPYNHKVELIVKEVTCDAPKNPVNGGYVNESVSNDGSFKSNNKIRYYCDQGFELVGEALHTCNGASRGWSAQEPHCEPKYMAQLKQQCGKLEDKVDNIDRRLNATETTFASYDNQMTASRNGMENISKTVADINDKLTDCCSNMTWIINEVADIKKRPPNPIIPTQSADDVANINRRLSAIENKDGDTEIRMTNLNNKLTPIENELKSMDGRVAGVTSRVANVENSVTSIDGKVANVESGVTSVNGRVATVENSVASVSSRVANAENGLTNVNTRMANAENSVSGVNNRVAKVEGINSRVGNVEGSVNSINSRVAAFENSLTGINNDISAQNTKLAEIEKLIKECQCHPMVGRHRGSHPNHDNSSPCPYDHSGDVHGGHNHRRGSRKF